MVWIYIVCSRCSYAERVHNEYRFILFRIIILFTSNANIWWRSTSFFADICVYVLVLFCHIVFLFLLCFNFDISTAKKMDNSISLSNVRDLISVYISSISRSLLLPVSVPPLFFVFFFLLIIIITILLLWFNVHVFKLNEIKIHY